MTRFALIAAATALTFVSSSAAASTFTLTFDSLPSAQGWTYVADGDGATLAESSAFSLSGGELVQNSLGVGMTRGGGNLYYRSSGLNPGDNWSINLVARVSGYESVNNLPFGFGVGGDGGGALNVGIGQSPIAFFNSSAGVTLAPLAGFDPSVYNNYELRVVGGLQSFLVNGVSAFSGQPIFGSAAPSLFFFGDGTGFANANVNIRSLVITTPGGVPEPASWALMIAGFGLVGSAMRGANARRNGKALSPA